MLPMFRRPFPMESAHPLGPFHIESSTFSVTSPIPRLFHSSDEAESNNLLATQAGGAYYSPDSPAQSVIEDSPYLPPRHTYHHHPDQLQSRPSVLLPNDDGNRGSQCSPRSGEVHVQGQHTVYGQQRSILFAQDTPQVDLPGVLLDENWRPKGIFPKQAPNQGYNFGSPSSASPSSEYDSLAASPATQIVELFTNTPLTSYPDAGQYLRQQLSLPRNCEVNLKALPDPPKGAKPTQTLPILVKLAIYGSPYRRLTLSEIYEALEQRFEWFRENRNDNSWKNSIRHNLSLNQVFRKIPRPPTAPGKGSFWELDISKGEGNKRPRKRLTKSRKSKVPASNTSTVDTEMRSENEDYLSSSEGSINAHDQLSNTVSQRSSVTRRTSPYPLPSESISPKSPPHITGSAPLPATEALRIPEIQPRFGEPSFQLRPGYHQSPSAPQGVSWNYANPQSPPVPIRSNTLAGEYYGHESTTSSVRGNTTAGGPPYPLFPGHVPQSSSRAHYSAGQYGMRHSGSNSSGEESMQSH